MTRIALPFFVALAAYSIALIGVEAQTSQDFVRHYFSDIDGQRPFFAMNTTLSTFLLAGAAILLIFAACSGASSMARESRWLMWSQAGMLGFLAFDDRFMVHEALAYRLGMGDHFIMATWAAIEVGFLLALSRLNQIPVRTFMLFAAGCVFFAIMMLFDAVLPHDMFLRLSIEDLAKSWAAAMFFAATWCLARFQIGFDPTVATMADWLASQRDWRLSEHLNGAD